MAYWGKILTFKAENQGLVAIQDPKNILPVAFKTLSLGPYLKTRYKCTYHHK